MVYPYIVFYKLCFNNDIPISDVLTSWNLISGSIYKSFSLRLKPFLLNTEL
jgi:hypothetical protein